MDHPMKLIDNWKQSYKLYSVQIALAIMLVSILDIILRQYGEQVPYWVFYLTGPGVAIARLVQQFFDREVEHGDDAN